MGDSHVRLRSGGTDSLVHLKLEEQHRRGWSRMSRPELDKDWIHPWIGLDGVC